MRGRVCKLPADGQALALAARASDRQLFAVLLVACIAQCSTSTCCPEHVKMPTGPFMHSQDS